MKARLPPKLFLRGQYPQPRCGLTSWKRERREKVRDRGRDRQIRENSVNKYYLLGFQFLHLQNRDNATI